MGTQQGSGNSVKMTLRIWPENSYPMVLSTPEQSRHMPANLSAACVQTRNYRQYSPWCRNQKIVRVMADHLDQRGLLLEQLRSIKDRAQRHAQEAKKGLRSPDSCHALPALASLKEDLCAYSDQFLSMVVRHYSSVQLVYSLMPELVASYAASVERGFSEFSQHNNFPESEILRICADKVIPSICRVVELNQLSLSERQSLDDYTCSVDGHAEQGIFHDVIVGKNLHMLYRYSDSSYSMFWSTVLSHRRDIWRVFEAAKRNPVLCSVCCLEAFSLGELTMPSFKLTAAILDGCEQELKHASNCLAVLSDLCSTDQPERTVILCYLLASLVILYNAYHSTGELDDSSLAPIPFSKPSSLACNSNSTAGSTVGAGDIFLKLFELFSIQRVYDEYKSMVSSSTNPLALLRTLLLTAAGTAEQTIAALCATSAGSIESAKAALAEKCKDVSEFGTTVKRYLTEVLASEAICLVCQDVVQSPCALPCGHIFCECCVQGLRGTSFIFACPLCRERCKSYSKLFMFGQLLETFNGCTSMSPGTQSVIQRDKRLYDFKALSFVNARVTGDACDSRVELAERILAGDATLRVLSTGNPVDLHHERSSPKVMQTRNQDTKVCPNGRVQTTGFATSILPGRGYGAIPPTRAENLQEFVEQNPSYSDLDVIPTASTPPAYSYDASIQDEDVIAPILRRPPVYHRGQTATLFSDIVGNTAAGRIKRERAPWSGAAEYETNISTVSLSSTDIHLHMDLSESLSDIY